MDAANDIQKTRYQSMCCTKWWILRWNNFLFLTRYPYNAQFIEKYPRLDFSSFFRNEVRMFLHFLPWWRGTWNPVNHLPSLLHSLKYLYFVKCLFYFPLANEIRTNWFLSKYGIAVHLNGPKVLPSPTDLLRVINWASWEGFSIVFPAKMNTWTATGDPD